MWYSLMNHEHFNILNTCVFCVCGKRASELIPQLISKHVRHNPQKRKEDTQCCQSFFFFFLFFNYLYVVIYFDIFLFFYISIWNCRSVEILTEAKLSSPSFVPTSYRFIVTLSGNNMCCYDFGLLPFYSFCFALFFLFVFLSLWGQDATSCYLCHRLGWQILCRLIKSENWAV